MTASRNTQARVAVERRDGAWLMGVVPGRDEGTRCMLRVRPVDDYRTGGEAWARRLLVLLLALALDVEFLLLAPEITLALPLELVPVDRQRVVDGDLVIHDFPHGG